MIRRIEDADIAGKRVLVRVDFNVPMQGGSVSDDTRLRAALPTIAFLREAGAKVILMAHFGRPKGKRDPQMSLAPVATPLSDLIGHPVKFVSDCVGEDPKGAISFMKAGDVLLLENTRFHEGEESNDPAFSAQLAELADVYVNDAFSAAHRAHASTEGLAHHLPAVPGPLMTAELCALEKALENPRRPAAAIVGGSKVSTKLGVLHNLIRRVDLLVLGGGMANTFLAAKGLGLGSSLAERGAAEQARTVLSAADKRGCEVLLPRDAVCVQQIREGAPATIFPVDEIPDGWAAIDLGPASVQAACQKLGSCRATLWNGPMGVFEIKPFDAGTTALARCVANFTHSGQMISVAGGGDTNAALENAGVVGAFTYLSLAGGAFLEWLEGRTLPGVAALQASSAAA